MPFAEYTKVSVQQTQNDIEKLVTKAGATHFASFKEPESAMIAFRLKERNIRFKIALPKKMNDQEVRSRWRAMLLVIKAKLESVEANIETLEEAFLSQVVMPGGDTVYEHIRDNVALNYTGQNVPLLPGPMH
jgi:L-rhamnose mutarotase